MVQHRIPLLVVEAITTIPSTLRRVVRLIVAKTITNPIWSRYSTIRIIEGAVGADIASCAGNAITTIPSTILRVKRLTITTPITNPCRNRYRTLGIALDFANEPGITRSTAITTIPSALRSVVRLLQITKCITNIFRNRYRTIGIANNVADGPGIIRSTAITTFPSALRSVVHAITFSVTNKLRIWIRYRTVGIIEGAVEAEIALWAVDAITTIPCTPLRVVRLAITITITNIFRNRYRTPFDLQSPQFGQLPPVVQFKTFGRFETITQFVVIVVALASASKICLAIRNAYPWA
jgi:hypothetical protein